MPISILGEIKISYEYTEFKLKLKYLDSRRKSPHTLATNESKVGMEYRVAFN